MCVNHWANLPVFLSNQTKGNGRRRMGPEELHSQFRRAPCSSSRREKRVRYGWGICGKSLVRDGFMGGW